MTNRSKLSILLVITGYLSFLVQIGRINLLVVISSLFFLSCLGWSIKFKKSFFSFIFPLSSGLLTILMRFFYWDHFDYIQRVNNLLLISIIFSTIIITKNTGWPLKLLNNFNLLTLKKRLLLIFIIIEFFFIISSGIIMKKGIKISGDEPHYMVIAHSIANDLDINVFDQYARDRYRDFLDKGIKHHCKPGIGFKKWYSIHLPGTALTISPFFLFKIPNQILYFLLRAYMGLFGALVAILLYLFSLKLFNSKNIALFISTVFSLSTPILFLSIHIYPEVQVLMLLLASLYILLFAENKNPVKILTAGLFLSITVFWGMKYAIFVAFFTLGFMIHYLRKKDYKKMIVFAVFPLICGILFLLYLYLAYGNFSPNSIYYGIISQAEKAKIADMVLNKVTLKMRAETILNYFFDQRDGLLLYNPLFFFAFPGIILAFKKIKIYKNYLLLSIPSLIFLLYHGFSTVRAGYCPQARYLTPIIWTLILFVIVYYLETNNNFFKRLILFLPFYSLFITVFQIFNPFSLYQPTTHDSLFRPGLIFQQFSNIYIKLSNFLPSFIRVNNNEKFLPNLIFLLLSLIFLIFALKKVKTTSFKPIGICAFIILFLFFSLFPRPPIYNPILITQSGDLPHQIYNINNFPTKKKEVGLKILDNTYHSFVFSTLKKVDSFVIHSKDLFDKINHLHILNFDREIIPKISAASNNYILLTKPEYIQKEHRYYYQFYLKADDLQKKDSPLFFKLFPQNHRNIK